MHQTTHFFNLGYGWLCKHCSAEAAERKHRHHDHNTQKAQPPALAKWVDDQHFRGLMCPRCGIAERLR
jgi:hypothetical protein